MLDVGMVRLYPVKTARSVSEEDIITGIVTSLINTNPRSG
jgi:hypothetical protein